MLLAAQAKVFTSESAIQVVNDALQFFGARGYSRELPLERMARDVRMFTIGGGTAEVLRTVVAGALVGEGPASTRGGARTDQPSSLPLSSLAPPLRRFCNRCLLGRRVTHAVRDVHQPRA